MQKHICTLSFVCFLQRLQSCRYLFEMIVLRNILQIIGLKFTILHGKVVLVVEFSAIVFLSFFDLSARVSIKVKM